MSKKVKQYLMLLAAVGVIAVVAGGSSGTFAGFNAQVANTGNFFQTGTLFLHDNGGTNTCTSESDSNNQNTTGSGCDVLFSVPQITAGQTYPAELTLTNAGSLNASDIQFELPSGCTDAKPSIGTLGTGLTNGSPVTSVTIANLSQTLTTGVQIQLHQNSDANTQTFTVTGGPYAPGSSVVVNVSGSPNANFSYTNAATVSFAAFGTALCGQLQLTIQEMTTNSFGTPVTSTCAYPASTLATCAFPSNALSTAALTSFQPLQLGSGTGGNSTTELDAGKSRYFLISIKAPATLANNAQNDKVSFDMRWQIDQA
ncbi:MAG TPA: hypothetical protein VFB25_02500 [Gaiellaceae bacterium]|nr:hypothetical protein [Gaiellaceae bacterium]